MKIWDKERIEKDRYLKNLRKIMEKEDNKKESLEKQLNSLNLEIARNKQQLDENNKYIALTTTKINQLAENKDPKEYKTELQNKIQKIEESEKTLRTKVEKTKILYQKITKEKAIAENNKTNLTNDYEKKKLELEERLKKQNFDSIEKVEQYFIEEEQLKELEKQITAYDDDVKKTDNNLTRINKALDSRSLTEEDWIKTQKLLNEKKNICEEKTKAIGETQQIVNDVKKKLDIVKELKKEEKKVNDKLDLLLELSEILKGNRFVNMYLLTN